MKTLTIGKLRGLQQCTWPHGTFTCLALDHRQNLRKANPNFVEEAQLCQFKLEVTRELAPHASAVLLDPEVSAAQAIAMGALPGGKGLVVALEATGYTGEAGARKAQIIPGWSAAKAKRMGASMVKLLVYYHPQAPTAGEIEDFTARIAAECSDQDLALMVEPLSYSLEEAKLSGEEKRRVVVETARRLTAIPGVEVLKVELAGDTGENDPVRLAQACAEVSAASAAPWILLSAAAGYETFLSQVIAACGAGASGIAVGRGVWQEAVQLSGARRLEFLRGTGNERLRRLAEVCRGLARPVTEFYQAEAPFDWYKRYHEAL